MRNKQNQKKASAISSGSIHITNCKPQREEEEETEKNVCCYCMVMLHSKLHEDNSKTKKENVLNINKVNCEGIHNGKIIQILIMRMVEVMEVMQIRFLNNSR